MADRPPLPEPADIMQHMAVRDLIIVGAGPSGLSAAIAAKQRGLEYQVLERGTLVNSIYHFPPQMVFFTTPELLEIGGLPFVSPYDKPTRAEALRYYRKVVDVFDLQIAYDETVLSIQPEPPEDRRPIFGVETRSGRGVRRVRHANNVILAIGYYDRPNVLNIPGEDLPHVHHYYGETHPYLPASRPHRRRRQLSGGMGARALPCRGSRHADSPASRTQADDQYWVRPDIENRIKEGSIGARFNTRVTEIRPTSVLVASEGEGAGRTAEELPADDVFLLTGYHTDWDLMERAGVTLLENRTPSYNPATFETNIPGLFLAGGAICGRDTSNIFIENGRFHGETIVATIAARQSPEGEP